MPVDPTHTALSKRRQPGWQGTSSRLRTRKSKPNRKSVTTLGLINGGKPNHAARTADIKQAFASAREW